jgi:hypothetical protein
MAVAVGGLGVSIEVGGAVVAIDGRMVLVASLAIRLTVWAVGVLMAEGDGVTVAPQPARRSIEHVAKATRVPRTIATTKNGNGFVDISSLLKGNNSLSRRFVQVRTGSFHAHTHFGLYSVLGS